MNRHAGTVLALGSVFALGSAMPPAWAHGTTERISVSLGGAQGNGSSFEPAISAGGRFVAFGSAARHLVPGDTNNVSDVFVRDRQTGTTRRVSVSSGAAQGNNISSTPSLSANGRFVAFTSAATNLVPGDTNDFEDIFVHDRRTGTTERVSVSSGGAQGNNISGDYNYTPSISADGRFVAFYSFASNLVPDDTNGVWDIFVHDRQTGKTRRVSVSSGGAQGNDFSAGQAISANGRFVAFWSGARNLVPGDTLGFEDVFVHDRRTGTTERVSVSSGGAQGNDYSYEPAISADGRFVAFVSGARNLVPGDTNNAYDIYVRDRQTGTTERVSVSSGGAQGNSYSYTPAISAGGRFVAFWSEASNLVPDDTNGVWDVFVHDRQTGRTRRVSVSSGGAQGNSYSLEPAISADGRFVAFVSESSNLVPGDTNHQVDVFVRTLVP